MWDFYGSIFSFLDMKKVRERFNGDSQFFIDTIRTFVEKDSSAELSTTYEDRNLYQYSCLLQALRENSELIGAGDVAAIARTCSVVHPQMKAASAALHSRLRDGLVKMDTMGRA